MELHLSAINENEVLSFLGYTGGEIPDSLLEDIHTLSEQLKKTSTPKLTYRIFERDSAGQIPHLGFPLKGNDIHQMLADSHLVILFAVTLGAGVDAYMRRLQITDMGKALIFDACANSAVEVLCDEFCSRMEQQYKYTTDRFSPGYGDLPFEQQFDFAEALRLPNTIGVTLTDSALMIPQKSVTAILGISNTKQTKRFRGCSHCNLFRTCTLRKEGKTCGNF